MNTIVIKLGGAPARDRVALANLSAEIRELSAASRVAIVHGGGGEVSALSRQLGITPRFSDGVRMTSDEEMDLVDMVLCGLVNKRLVRALSGAGVPAVGISGADGLLFCGEPLPDDAGRTARVASVNPGILDSLWKSGYVPVIASPGSDGAFRAVNINADEVTFAVGDAVAAEEMVFISDVAGVLDAEGRIIRELTPERIGDLVRTGAITGGMVEKLKNAVAAVSGGGLIVIGAYDSPGAFGRLVGGESGTRIYREEE